MTKKTKSSQLSDSVMEKINNGDINMKPKLYFALLSFVSIATIIFSAIAIAYLSSIIYFWSKVQFADTMAWGARANLANSVASFPLWALIASIILVIISITLIRHRGHMYRHKVSTIVAVFIMISLIIGLILSLIGIGKTHNNDQNNRYGQNFNQKF